MKRKLRTFGFLDPDTRRGTLITNATTLRIYEKLKQRGFKETGWQFVYQGQLGGIVIPHTHGIDEVHIRFYEDRCFAEFEIGRALISHFFGPQYNAKNYVKDYCREFLTDAEWLHFSTLLDSQLADDEACLPIWDKHEHFSPYLTCIKSTRKHRNIKKTWFAGLAWKNIAALFSITALVTLAPASMAMALIICSAWLASSLALPGVGKP